MAYGGALLRRWWQHRVGSNPTPSVRLGGVQTGLVGFNPRALQRRAQRGFGSERARRVERSEDREATAAQSHSRRKGREHGSHHGFVGRVAEWLKAHDWKSCGLTPAWVRIPPRPWLSRQERYGGSNPRDLRRRAQRGFDSSGKTGNREAPERQHARGARMRSTAAPSHPVRG